MLRWRNTLFLLSISILTSQAVRAGSISVSINGPTTIDEGQFWSGSAFVSEGTSDYARGGSWTLSVPGGSPGGNGGSLPSSNWDNASFGLGSFHFAQSGTFTLTLNASAPTYYLNYEQTGYYQVPRYNSWGSFIGYDYYPVYGYVEHARNTASGSDSHTILVRNLDPLIASVSYATQLPSPSSQLSFAAAATDPGADALTYNWDFDGDGLYDDFSGSSGQYVFGTAGVHDFSLRVSDGQGGFAYGSYQVAILDPVAAAAPEPASLALMGVAGLTIGGYTWKRRKKAAPITVN